MTKSEFDNFCTTLVDIGIGIGDSKSPVGAASLRNALRHVKASFVEEHLKYFIEAEPTKK